MDGSPSHDGIVLLLAADICTMGAICVIWRRRCLRVAHGATALNPWIRRDVAGRCAAAAAAAADVHRDVEGMSQHCG